MAIVKKYLTEVTNIETPTPEVHVVTFKSLKRGFKFKPGQFLHLALDEYNPSLPWPDSRCFSMQTPSESEHLKITFSEKGKFTKRMASELKVGKQVYLKLPYGDLFTNSHNKENCIFIAGGTGITPYLSLFNSQSFKEYTNPYLYLGFRNDSFNIYSKDLNKIESINPSFKMNLINQEEKGLLDIESIFSTHGTSSTYFISGPPEMIKEFKSFLKSKGLPEDNVRTDDWE